jgi:hypothetical protein
VITAGRFLSGEWVPADDSNGRWLRVDLGSLDEIQGQSSWPYGYIWDGNLRPAQLSPNGPGAAGPSSTLRSDLQALADSFHAAADLSSALEALADIVGVLTKMRDAGDLYIATQVFEIYDAPGSELALADMTRKNVWTLSQMVSTGLLKGWYARAKETGRKPPIRYEYAEVMVQNVLYAARAGSGDVPGAIADASGDQIDRIKEIAITYQQIRGQNEILVHNALNSALLDLDRYSMGELDYKFVLQNIINSRQIATELDSTTRRVMRDDTSTRLAIVADLQEIKLKVLRGDDVSVLLESMKAQYRGNAFAKDAAFLLGIPGWNNQRQASPVNIPSSDVLTGSWIGYATSGSTRLDYKWDIRQTGELVSGTVSIRRARRDPWKSYLFEGSYANGTLSFRGLRWSTSQNSSFCLAKGQLRYRLTNGQHELVGQWEENNIPGGCLRNTSGTVQLTKSLT